MDEAVARAVFIRDEAIALVAVEEFDFADRHECFLSRKQDIRRQKHRQSWKREKGRIAPERSEEHTSELQSLMRISYAVFCLKKKKKTTQSRDTYIPTYDKKTTKTEAS